MRQLAEISRGLAERAARGDVFAYFKHEEEPRELCGRLPCSRRCRGALRDVLPSPAAFENARWWTDFIPRRWLPQRTSANPWRGIFCRGV